MATKRPDLSAQEYKRPGMIGEILFPMLPRAVKQGVLYYQDIIADGTAQHTRSLGTAPTATLLTDAKTSFNLEGDEYIDRRKIDDSTITGCGGLATAQEIMARVAMRTVMNAHEAAVVAATFGTITAVDIGSSFLAALQIARESIQDYGAPGQIALFGAQRMIDRLKRYNEVVERMTFPNVFAGDPRDVRAISDQTLAATIGVDRVLSGPNDTTYGWLGASSTYDGYLGLCILPTETVDPLEELQLGRTVSLSNGTDSFMEVSTYHSDDLKSEVLDAQAWIELHTLNVELAYVMKGVDEENTVTTTAS